MPVLYHIALGDGVREAFLLLTTREIFHPLIKKGVAFVEGGSLDRFVNAFPTQLTSRDDIKLLKTLPTVDTYRNVLDAFYEANKVGASANSRPTQTKYEAHQLSEIPDAKIDSDLVVDLL